VFKRMKDLAKSISDPAAEAREAAAQWQTPEGMPQPGSSTLPPGIQLPDGVVLPEGFAWPEDMGRPGGMPHPDDLTPAPPRSDREGLGAAAKAKLKYQLMLGDPILGELEVPGELELDLPAGEIVLVYEEILRAGLKEHQTFSAPSSLNIEVVPVAGGEPVHLRRFDGASHTGKGQRYRRKHRKFTLQTPGAYRITASGGDLVRSPRINVQ
jgi:hypothetical protein